MQKCDKKLLTVCFLENGGTTMVTMNMALNSKRFYRNVNTINSKSYIK